MKVSQKLEKSCLLVVPGGSQGSHFSAFKRTKHRKKQIERIAEEEGKNKWKKKV